MSNFLRYPKTMPSAAILRYLAFPPPKEHFLASVSANGRPIKPRISVQKQVQLANICKMAGIQPDTIGLPPLEEKKVKLLALGNTKLREKVKRSKKIKENMAQMDKKVADYRKEFHKKKQSSKSELPF